MPRPWPGSRSGKVRFRNVHVHNRFDGEEVDIVLRPFGEMPGRISRLHRGDVETQMWEASEWGLKDSKQLAIIDEMPASEITDMLISGRLMLGTWENRLAPRLHRGRGAPDPRSKQT